MTQWENTDLTELEELVSDTEETWEQTDRWTEFDAPEDTEWEAPEDTEWDAPEDGALDREVEAQKAAEYARSLGFGKAGDYIERHYDGDAFVPGEPIRVTTRNMALEGTASASGIPFARRVAPLTEGLAVEGVFPEFESKHQVDLGQEANDMSLHQQFSACREDFQLHLFDTPEKLDGLTLGDMERLDEPQGYTPEGWVWQHDPVTGRFELVRKEDHEVGHTGGNAFWGKYVKGIQKSKISGSDSSFAQIVA